VVPAIGAIITLRCFGDVGHGVGDGGRIRTDDRINTIFRDQFLVDAHCSLFIRRIITNDELDRTSEDSTLRVQVLLTELVAVTPVTAL